jgi:hypothetical protein
MMAVTIRRHLSTGLVSVFVVFAALVGIALFAPPSSRSPRVQAVQRLIDASRAGDIAAFSKLVPENVPFWVLSDVVVSLTPAEMRRFAGRCQVQDVAEGMDTVAVSLACVGAAKRKIVDFTFCDDRISKVEHVEWGRWILSPLFSDLLAHGLGRTKGTCPAPR